TDGMATAAKIREGIFERFHLCAENINPALQYAIYRALDRRSIRTILRQRGRPRDRRTHRALRNDCDLWYIDDPASAGGNKAGLFFADLGGVVPSKQQRVIRI